MGKKIEIVGAVIVSLSLCWFVGQQIKMVNEERKAQEAESGLENGSSEEVTVPFLWSTAVLEGGHETDDNPWGATACWFDMEGEGDCILLNPNTAIHIKDIDSQDILTFDYVIHPWVSEQSDGSGLIVQLENGQGDALDEVVIAVDATNGWQRYELDLSEHEAVAGISILCNNGGNENDNGDWTIIKPIRE